MRQCVACVAVLAAGVGVSARAMGQCQSQWVVENVMAANTPGAVMALMPWDPDGPGPLGPVMVAGGSFASVAGLSAAGRLACFDGVNWNPVGTEPIGTGVTVRALAVGDDHALLVAGDFSAIAGVAANGIARWDGSSWSSFGDGLTGGSVEALAVLPGGDIVAAGRFTAAGGQPAAGIARWSGGSWQALASSITAAGSTTPRFETLLVLPGGQIIAGGAFTSINGLPMNHLARWSGGGWSDVGGGVAHGGAFANSARVDDVIRLPSGHLVVCGFFASVGTLDFDGPIAARSIARWDGAQWWPMPGVGMSQSLDSVRRLGDGTIVTGRFTGPVGGESYSGIARWTGSAWTDMDAVRNQNSINAMAELPGGGFFVGSNAGFNLTVGGNNVSLGMLARWTPDGVPFIAHQPGDADAQPGGSAQFDAVPAAGYDALEGASAYGFQWQWRSAPGLGAWQNLADGPLAGVGDVAGAASGSLVIDDLAAGIGIELRCVVDNGCGQATSASAVLSVEAPPCPADTNGDGVVTAADFSAWVAAFNAQAPECDQNGDGDCTAADFSAWVANYNAGCD